MYSFEEFKEQIISSTREMLTDRYEGVEVTLCRNMKNNCTLTGVVCNFLGPNLTGLCPTFYLEPLYELYKQGCSIEDVCSGLEEKLMESILDIGSVKEHVNDYADAKDKIIFHFIHTNQNEEWLKELPHREFLDMSIVYRWIVDINGKFTATAPINNNLARLMQLDEAELYQLAYENTKRILKPTIMTMKEDIKRMLLEFEQYEDLQEIEQVVAQFESPMYVVSNSSREKGAISILYMDELHGLAEQLDSDLYLIPTSCDEMVAVPADGPELQMLLDTLHEKNQITPIEHRLSNEIYKYDRSAQNIVQATNSGMKMLVADEHSSDLGMGMC